MSDKIAVADLRSTIRLVIKALDKSVSEELVKKLNATPKGAQQGVLDFYAKDKGIAGDDLKDLMYDLGKAGFQALKKPADDSPAKKPPTSSGGKIEAFDDLANAGFSMLNSKELWNKGFTVEDGAMFYEGPYYSLIATEDDGELTINGQALVDVASTSTKWKGLNVKSLISKLDADQQYAKACKDYNDLWNKGRPYVDSHQKEESEIATRLAKCADKYLNAKA
jgi:hypothetical protein